MGHRRAPVGLFACALGIAAAVIARAGDPLGVGGSPDFGWKQWVVLGVAVVLVVLGAVLLAPAAADALRERATAPLAARPWPRGAAGLLVAVSLAVGAAVLIWTRCLGVDNGLWHDEAFSVLHYARGGPRTILTSQEYVPNDHVLFNLLSWATAAVLGEGPATRRLWAVLPSLMAVALIAAWAWRRLGPGTTVALVLLVALAPTHLDLAKEARGYGLMLLCAAAALVAADRVAHGGGRGALAGFAVAGFAGIATLPVFVISFLAQAVPLLARRDLRERALLAVIVVGIASLGLYWSLLEDVVGNASQEFGPLIPWHGVVTGPIDALLGPLLGIVVDRQYRPDLLWRLAAAAPVLIGFVVLVRRREGALAAALAIPLLGTYAALMLGRFHVETRFTSYLLFHALVPAAVALSAAGAAIARVRLLRPLATSLAALAAAIALGHLLVVAKAHADRPLEAFAEAADVVRGTGISRVVSDTVRPDGLRYALGEHAFATLPADQLQQVLCREPGPLVFIEHRFARPAPTDTGCLVRRGASKVQLVQRSRGFISIWILPQKPR